MLGILLAVALLIFGYTKRASGTSSQIESEPTPYPSVSQMASVGHTQSFPEETAQPSPEPTKEPSPTPAIVKHEETPKPTVAPKLALKPATVPQKRVKSSTLRVDCTKNPKHPGCCVDVLKAEGDIPDKKVTKDGFARSIPSKPVDIKKLEPGTEMVIKTKESSMGHVVKVKINEEGQAVSIKEGGHPEGEGRVVSPSVIVGEVSL